ncbi:MAG: hypothetical protein NZ578_04590 [Candidatus Binatia bacterium]|nr:hypothetical protein [Candidatus Binatia bacterium]
MAYTSPIAVRISVAVVPKQSGVVLIATLFLLALLMIIAMSGLVLSRTDLFISRNLLTGTQALWIARAGAEIGKNWLQTNRPSSALPVTLGPAPLANGTYTATLVALGNGMYRVTAVGVGPEHSRRVVAETVQLPDFTPLGVVTSAGDGLHADFDDTSGGTGRRIPDFSIDGRNHAVDGSLSQRCPAIAPFAVTQASAQDNLIGALATLKREVVARANSFCLADGSSAEGPCTPGLAWVRGAGALPRFTSGPCVASDPACFLNLDLAAPALRAQAHPADLHLPRPPNDRGPFTPGAPIQPFVRLLSATEQTRLQTALRDIVARIDELPADTVLSITASITAGTHTYGTFARPRVTLVEDGGEALDVRGGAVVNGAGVLLVPRVLRLMNATLNWIGLVLITDDGDLRVEDPAACGQILGAVIVRDDAVFDRKFDLDLVQATGSCPPFAVNYSCEAVFRALTMLMRTVSWTEQSGT